ncbi:hypothetical protein P3X46_007934 [Hevea brasiliensis]|uniref:FAS1 domain-containing protein n=1 Tax=Hevea brasiliensis TaxID=3981 RepID=A0ABQ9MXH0_HEVBR|nr:fasciclin-like arabinogalactan protein 3 [Hevea brasiliensis]KAJ9184168.1 hypothetical protein P3X46_007934 [Hevea brasiliensis]
MDSKSSSFLFLALFALFSSTSMAFNITRILSSYPDFSTFNNLLTQTGLAQQINSRQTITILAVSNDAVGSLSGKPLDLTKRILGAHVVLDYYDQTKLKNLEKKSSILTTLYQTTGIADNQQGFLNITKTPNGIMFGSAVKGAPLTASLEGSVVSQPYNISVLKVSRVIEAPGIDNIAPSPPPGAPEKAPAPAPTKAKSPAPVAEEPVADNAPIEAPTEAPTPADAPEANAPISSPPEPNSTPADDATAPAVPPSQESVSSRMHAGGIVAVIGLVACMGF